MRVAILGDIHGDVQYLDYAMQSAASQGAKAMIQVGDFGFTFGDGFLTAVQNIADYHKLQLMAIRGNHDDPWWFRQYQRMGSLHLIPDGFTTTIGKKRVAFLGGAVSIDRDHRQEGISWWKEERVNPHIINAWLYNDIKADVLISHEAPLLPDKLPGILLPPDIKRDAEDDRNFIRTAAEVLEPDVIYHGHYHVRHTRDLYLDAKKTLVEGLNCNWVDLDGTMIIRDW